jgi:transglutaminase-like putative cysteine protease
MTMGFCNRCAAAVVLFACALPVIAQDKAEIPYVEKIWHGEYDVDKDGRVTQTVVARYQVLQESLLERSKVYSISFSTSIQTGEVLEAYTLKKDGRQVPVPPGNFQKQTNDGRAGAGPAFSDQTRLSVVFPDFAVGDSVHIRYRLTEKEPMFPGQFSQAFRFSPFVAYEDVRITVRAPREMALKTEAYSMKVEAASQPDGRQVLSWSYRNPQPRKYKEEADEGIWSLKDSPGLLISTFATYEAIAKAYGDRALPKAEPTPRVRELVAAVLAGETRPREKARLLYEWVSRNITYAGNCIGVGAVVPRDLNFVLDNKMGDCKDHATLLQAMLAVAGVPSEQVLVNAGGMYELPATPVVSMVNHVMNFLPEFNLYVDATAKEIPFGYLPDGTYEKPVIHVGAAKALAKVPSEKHEENQQRLHMTLKLAANGAASGAMKVTAKGARAANMRAYMRDMSADAEREFVKQALASYGYRGRGTLDRGRTDGLSDEYQYAVEFDIDNFLRGGSTGAFWFAPVIGTPFPVMDFANVPDRTLPSRAETCHGFHSYETLVFELPAAMELLSMPDDADFKGRLVDFSARYKKTANVVSIVRELHDKTPGNVCPPEMTADFIKQAIPVGENLRTQVLYKRAR